MRFVETSVQGAYVVEPERTEDERGFFARTFDAAEFESRGLVPDVAECSVAYNDHRHTLRGMHYQQEPYGEAKLVRCTRGSVYDVAVDLRPGSSTYLGWAAVELSAENGRSFYIPRGCAHGYLTTTDMVELHYQISAPFAPDAAAGVRWDDPAVSVDWPAPPRVISARDASYPDLQTKSE
jgi:dTDP-4-dehydrorhamnose 3,5-epimerase